MAETEKLALGTLCWRYRTKEQGSLGVTSMLCLSSRRGGVMSGVPVFHPGSQASVLCNTVVPS